MRRDVAKKMRDHALRKIVGLDLVGDREFLQARHESPMATDDTPDQSRMAEMVEAPVPPIPLPRGVNQRQIPRPPHRLGFPGEEQLLQRNCDALRKADSDEAPGRHGVAVANQTDRIARRDDLAAMSGPQRREKRMALFLNVRLPARCFLDADDSVPSIVRDNDDGNGLETGNRDSIRR